MIVGGGIVLALMIALGISMAVLSVWCAIDTYRSQDRTVDKLLSYTLDGCALATGLCGIVLAYWIISSFLQCR